MDSSVSKDLGWESTARYKVLLSFFSFFFLFLFFLPNQGGSLVLRAVGSAFY